MSWVPSSHPSASPSLPVFLPRSTDSNAASVEALSATTASFLTALATNFAVAGAEVLAFIIIRRQFRAIYEPRSFMPPGHRRVPSLTNSLLGVFWQIYQSDPKLILRKNGVDAYVYIRFLRMLCRILIPIWLISWAVLFPADAVKTKVAGKTGLEQLTYGNVSPSKQHRLWAHLVLAWVFTMWILYNLRVEMQKWVQIRQRHLVDPEHSRLAQANTVLITGIDKNYLDEVRLTELFGHLPGGVQKVWLNRNLKEMPGLHDARVKATKKLEAAQVALIKKARKIRVKRTEQIDKLVRKKKPIPNSLKEPINKEIIDEKKDVSPSLEVLREIAGGDGPNIDFVEADRLVPRDQRPTHRLPGKRLPFALPWTGTKVDTIDWARKEIVKTGMALDNSRQLLADDIGKEGIGEERYPPLNSAFLLFRQQIGAHLANQILLHNQPYKMSGTYIEVSPKDVVWSNLNLNPYDAFIRRMISYAITGGLIIIWSIPIAFIGAMSNAQSLCLTYSWMAWLCKLGNVPQGIITGVIPPVLLALVNLLLPVILRRLAQFEGIPRRTGIELSLMTRFTIMLVVNSFIVLTLASGLISTIPAVAKDPASIATILAQQLPQASTFFITWVTLQAAGIGGNLLQIISLLMYYVQLILLGGTPRKAWAKRNNLQTPSFGVLFPATSLLVVITLAYMIISPVINGLAFVACILTYWTQKYLFTWVIDQPPSTDTGGLFFPKAITHVFVGLYLQHICLAALFFLARDTANKASAIPQGALMIVLIVVTIAYQYVFQTSFDPLKNALPLTLAHLSYGMPKETGHHDSFIEAAGSEASYNAQADRGKDADGRGLARLSSDGVTAGNSADGLTDGQRNGDVEMAHLDGHTVAIKEGVVAQDFAPGAPHYRSRHHLNEAQMREAEETLDSDAFSHPATKEPQRIIWLPEDALGLAAAEARDNESVGIASTYQDATLNKKGHVEVTGPPPDDFEGDD